MTGQFAAATAVEFVRDGHWSATVAEGWDILGNTNGGYLLAIVGRAIAAETGRTDPVTVTAHYLAPGRAGAASVDVATIRSGRRFTTATGTLLVGDRPTITVLATFGELGPAAPVEPAASAESVEPASCVEPAESVEPGASSDSSSGAVRATYVDGGPPDLPPPSDCLAVTPADPFPPPFMGHVDLRLHPDDGQFLSGVRSGTPLLRGWFRLPGDEPVDTIALLTAVDSFPPTIFNLDVPIGWTPTLELTAHIRARPAPGWLACSYRTRFIAEGFLEVDGEIWDSEHRLVAQSRQLALVPRVDPNLSQP